MKDYDGSKDYLVQYNRETGSAYIEFNPKCKYCGLSLKRKEYESVEKDPVRSSPTYDHIIAKHYLCPDCKVPTEYRTIDLSRALSKLSGHMGKAGTFNIILDPFMRVELDR